MKNNCDCQKSDCNCNSSSSSGFIFGLILGAVIGAVVAVVIYKNNKGEVFEKLEQKIKDFFQNLIPQDESKKVSPQPSQPTVKKIIASKPITEIESPEIVPVFVKTKKPTPKTFLKPKK